MSRNKLLIVFSWLLIAAVTSRPHVLAEKLQIDASQSQVHFVGSKGSTRHTGSFSRLSGEFDTQTGRLAITIDTTSLTSDDAKLTQHLKSPDFLDVRSHPTATFVSTGLEADGRPGVTHMLAGNLTIHGVSRQVSVPTDIRWGGDTISITGSLTLRRSDFGIHYGAGEIDDEVRLQLTLKTAPRSDKTAPARQPLPAGTVLIISSRESRIEFTGSKPGSQHSGGFSGVSGWFNTKDGQLTFTLNMESVYTDNEKLTQHLISPDFFDARKFKTATFSSTSIRQDGAAHLITGNLKLHGVTRQVEIPANIRWENRNLVIDGGTVLRRSDFGMAYGLGEINDEVPIRFTLRASDGGTAQAPRPSTSR